MMDRIKQIQAILEKSGDRELEMIYSFACSVTRED